MMLAFVVVVVVFVALAFAAPAQDQPERPRGWQAYCFWGDTDWFGPCRNEGHHARMDRNRHNEVVHGGERRADYDLGECEPPTGGR